MNKLKLIILSLFLIIPFSVDADSIYNMDIKVDIQKDGSADVVETWDVKADSGTEWFKTFSNLGSMRVSDYSVWMDGKELKPKAWDVNGSLESKKGYYGINEIEDGFELCFGKYDMNKHTFTLKYSMSEYVFNTTDAQVIYNTLIPKGTVESFKVDITSYYSFPNNLDVWGYGYKGYAYVKDGKITLTSDNGLNGEYVVILAKFSKDTFNTNNTYEQFQTFNDVLEMASQGAYDHINSNENNSVNDNEQEENDSVKKQPKTNQTTKNSSTKTSPFVYIVVAEIVIIIGGVAYFIYKKKFK